MMATICDTTAKPQGTLLCVVQILLQIRRGDDIINEGKSHNVT